MLDISASPETTILLRDVTDADLPILFEFQREPEANAMAAFPARVAEAFYAHWAKIRGDEAVTIKTILLDGQVAGSIGSWKRDNQRLVGYWIGKAYWGKGVATQALAAFLEVVTARPLVAYVAKHNLGSIRVLEKCGFTLCRADTERLEPAKDGVEEVVFWIGTDCR